MCESASAGSASWRRPDRWTEQTEHTSPPKGGRRKVQDGHSDLLTILIQRILMFRCYALVEGQVLGQVLGLEHNIRFYTLTGFKVQNAEVLRRQDFRLMFVARPD